MPLQKMQSQARALVPITEADTEQEEMASLVGNLSQSQSHSKLTNMRSEITTAHEH